MQPSLDPYPLAQAILQRYVVAPGVIPRAAVTGKMLQTARLGADRMPILATVLRRWQTEDAGWTYAPSGLPHPRSTDPHRTAVSTVVQGRRVSPEFQDPLRQATAPKPRRMVATATRSGSRPQGAAGSAQKGPSQRTIGESLPVDRSGSTAARQSADGPGAWDQAPDAAQKNTAGARPAAAAPMRQTEPTKEDPERSIRSQAPGSAVPAPGAPVIRTKPARSAGAGDADFRLSRPLKRLPEPNQSSPSLWHRSGTQSLPLDRGIEDRPGRRSYRQTPEGAKPAVPTESARRTESDPAATEPVGIQKPMPHSTRRPARGQSGGRSGAAPRMASKFLDDIQPRHLTLQTLTDAAADKGHQVAGSRRGAPDDNAPQGLQAEGTQSPRPPPLINRLPTLHHKNRNAATDAKAGPQAEQAKPAPAAGHTMHPETAGGSPKSKGVAATSANTTGGTSNWGQRKSGHRQRANVLDDLPGASRTFSGQNMERHPAIPIIARSRRPAPGATKNKAPENLSTTTGADVQPVAGRILSSTPTMTIDLAPGRRPSIEPAGGQRGPGKDARPAAAVAPTAGPPPGPDRSSLVMQPSRTANINPTAIQPDSGFAAAPAGMPLTKPAATVGRQSLNRPREPAAIAGQPQTGTVPQSRRISSRADQQPMPVQPSTGRAHLFQGAYPSMLIARAPVTHQAKVHRPLDLTQRPVLKGSHNTDSHPLAAPKSDRMIHPKLNLHPAPTIRSDRLQRYAAGRPAGDQTVFRTTANSTLTELSAAARKPDNTATDALNDRSSQTDTGGDSIDLERLADEIYAILERRLTIERERLGQ